MKHARAIRWVSLAFGTLLTASSAPVTADTPLPPPKTYTLSSGSKGCFAVSDVAAGITTGFRTGPDGKHVKIWTVPGWYRVAQISSDCEYLVTGHGGINLIPVDWDRGLVMLTFYRRGALIRQVRLDELVRDLTKLRRTVSHVYWGNYHGREEDYLFRVETVDRGQLLFDMRTGLETSRPKAAEGGRGGAQK